MGKKSHLSVTLRVSSLQGWGQRCSAPSVPLAIRIVSWPVPHHLPSWWHFRQQPCRTQLCCGFAAEWSLWSCSMTSGELLCCIRDMHIAVENVSASTRKFIIRKIQKNVPRKTHCFQPIPHSALQKPILYQKTDSVIFTYQSCAHCDTIQLDTRARGHKWWHQITLCHQCTFIKYPPPRERHEFCIMPQTAVSSLYMSISTLPFFVTAPGVHYALSTHLSKLSFSASINFFFNAYSTHFSRLPVSYNKLARALRRSGFVCCDNVSSSSLDNRSGSNRKLCSQKICNDVTVWFNLMLLRSCGTHLTLVNCMTIGFILNIASFPLLAAKLHLRVLAVTHSLPSWQMWTSHSEEMHNRPTVFISVYMINWLHHVRALHAASSRRSARYRIKNE